MSEKLKIGIKKYKWFIIILTIIIFFIFIGCNHYAKRNECKDKCDYRHTVGGGYWKYKTIEGNSENFENQNQCVDYCLRHK